MIPAWLTDTVTSDLDRALHYTLLWGFEAVELRTVGGPGNRVPFVNEERLRRRLEENELPAVAIVPGLFEGAAGDTVAWMNEVASLEETLQFCTRIGCRRMVASAFAAEQGFEIGRAARALRQAGQAAARYGIMIAVLNESDMAIATGEQLAALLDEVDHPAVRAAWSPAAAVLAGEDAATGLKHLGERVGYVRCADVRRDRVEYLPLGEGHVDWETQMNLLSEYGYDGPLSVEVHVDPKPKTGLYDAAYLVQMIRKHARRS